MDYSRRELKSTVVKVKYNYGDLVAFRFNGKTLVGQIYIIDRYGTFEQNEEPSYDIMVENYNGTNEPCLIKHVRQSKCIDK